MNAAEPQHHIGRTLSRFSLARQWRLTCKEWAETLRDRRTILTLILMPILVYPLLGIVFRQFVFASLGPSGQPVLIGVENETTRARLRETLRLGEQWLRRQSELAVQGKERVEPPWVEEPAFDQIQLLDHTREEDLRSGKIDLFVTFEEPEQGGPAWKIHYAERSPGLAAVRSFVERRIRAFNIALSVQSNQPLHPLIQLGHVAIKASSPARSLLPALIPLVLLMMTITGAVYPAIDVTAGERERGTLEALMAAPVSRLGILLAKYVAVLTVAMLTAGVNLFSMTLTIYGAGLAETLFGSAGLSPLMLIAIFGLLLLFAGFFSAVLLAVTSFARSFKEAQAYLIPLMLLTLGPGLMSLSPAVELNAIWAMVPLMNVVLLARDLFGTGVEPLQAFLVVGSTLCYAALSITIAANIFGSDAILYGSSASWSGFWRRSPVTSESPSIAAALLVLALAFTGQIQLGGTAQLLASPWGVSGQLMAAGLATLLIFAGIPFVAASWEHVPLSRAFRSGASQPLAWIAAILLGLSAGILVMELTVLLLNSGWLELRDEFKKLVVQQAAKFQTIPLAVLLVTLAVIPAFAEELCFRGYLYRAWEKSLGPIATIFATAAAFAVFHLLTGAGISLERFCPPLVLGLLLGWVSWRTGSIWPGVLLHTLNNAVSLLIVRFRDDLTANGWLLETSEHVPMHYLIIAGSMTIAGIVLLLKRSRVVVEATHSSTIE